MRTNPYFLLIVFALGSDSNTVLQYTKVFIDPSSMDFNIIKNTEAHLSIYRQWHHDAPVCDFRQYLATKRGVTCNTTASTSHVMYNIRICSAL